MHETSRDRIDQIDAMRMGVDYRFTVRCRDFSLSLRPLTISEHMHIFSKVADRIQKVPENQKNRITENTLLGMETLIAASTSDYGVNDPKITEYILERMTDREIHFLWKQYNIECDKVDPSLERMDPKQLDNLIESLKKSPQDDLESQLIGLSLLDYMNICRRHVQAE